MDQINKINNWKDQLGLLPINLFSDINQNKYILLNGGSGDFCIDLNPTKTLDYYSLAWSSNTKNFVTFNENNIELYNWIKDKKESIPTKIVKDNLSKFYQYLVHESFKSEYDIVPFIIDVYRKLRNFTDEKKEGIKAINQLFILLAAYKDEEVDFNNLNYKKWNIVKEDNVSGMEKYLDYFKNGITPNKINIKPDIDLILRHASGLLFQEAQKEVIFYNRNQDLFGLHDSKYKFNDQISSSLHYTPSFLSRSIVEYSLSNFKLEEISNLKILDPACGSSEFLLETLKQLKTKDYTGKVEIHGWDCNETAINISKFLLAYENREWGNKLTINLKHVQNSLAEKWDDDYDLIFMNPPYTSWELLDKENREIVSSVLNENLQKKPNLASAFIFKSIQHLKENGIVGTVMPSSILLMDSYKKLRNFIQDTLTLILVGKLGNFVFEHALTDVSILIGKKLKSNTNPLILWTKNEKGAITDAFRDIRKVNYGIIPHVKDNKLYNIYPSYNYPMFRDWKIISSKEVELKQKLNKLIYDGKLKLIRDIFDVKQGIRLGSKSFIISKVQYDKLPEIERKYFRASISSIKNGMIIESDYFWYPYDITGLLIKNEDSLKINVSYFYNHYLLPVKEKLLILARKNENNWWTLSEHRAWLREVSAKIISTEFGNAGSFAYDKTGEFVIERGNGWIPRKEFRNQNYFYFYLSVFNSNFFEELLSIFSKQLAGGKWFDLGKKYTGNIPIPEITKELECSIIYDKMVTFGKLINQGEFYKNQELDDILKSNIYLV